MIWNIRNELGVYDGNNSWRMAKATLRALHFCVDTGFHSFILECSNVVVVSLLQGDNKCYNELEWIIRNIQDVQRVLGAISFSVISKTCNHVAQTVVGFAKEKEEASIWLEECPSFLSPFVLNLLIDSS